MSQIVDIPIFRNTVVVLIIGIIIGFLILTFINNQRASLECNSTEKFTQSNKFSLPENTNDILNGTNNQSCKPTVLPSKPSELPSRPIPIGPPIGWL